MPIVESVPKDSGNVRVKWYKDKTANTSNSSTVDPTQPRNAQEPEYSSLNHQKTEVTTAYKNEIVNVQQQVPIESSNYHQPTNLMEGSNAVPHINAPQIPITNPVPAELLVDQSVPNLDPLIDSQMQQLQNFQRRIEQMNQDLLFRQEQLLKQHETIQSKQLQQMNLIDNVYRNENDRVK
jgi:hypothetical protein